MNVNILDFGASVTRDDNAPAITAAITACHENGGGCVTVPAGRFVSGTVYLKDNVELHLEAGAVLKASADMSVYNPLEAYPQNFGSVKEGGIFATCLLPITCNMFPSPAPES